MGIDWMGGFVKGFTIFLIIVFTIFLMILSAYYGVDILAVVVYLPFWGFVVLIGIGCLLILLKGLSERIKTTWRTQPIVRFFGGILSIVGGSVYLALILIRTLVNPFEIGLLLVFFAPSYVPSIIGGLCIIAGRFRIGAVLSCIPLAWFLLFFSGSSSFDLSAALYWVLPVIGGLLGLLGGLIHRKTEAAGV
jgi:hypothetical protein